MAAAKIVSFLGQGFTFLRFSLSREICRDRESHITQRLLDLRKIFENKNCNTALQVTYVLFV